MSTAMQLIRKMHNPNNKVVLQAVEELRAHGWLSDNALSGAYLWFIHSQDADLHQANLRGADLYKADMSGADLSLANLGSANL